jgi:hypothetical protein
MNRDPDWRMEVLPKLEAMEAASIRSLCEDYSMTMDMIQWHRGVIQAIRQIRAIGESGNGTKPVIR